MANFFLPAALWTWLVQWFTNCADGLLEAAAVLSERTCEWLTVVTDASLLIVLWLCLTTLLKVLIITFPRGLMAMPQRKIWRGPTRCVSSPHSCFEFIIFVLLSPSYFICRKIPVAIWTSGVWVKSEVVSQKTRIDLLSKHTMTLRNCLTLWAWFLHFKKGKSFTRWPLKKFHHSNFVRFARANYNTFRPVAQPLLK